MEKGEVVLTDAQQEKNDKEEATQNKQIKSAQNNNKRKKWKTNLLK